MAHFCTKTGVRIAKPGVSKAVDPERGHDEVVEVDGIELPADAGQKLTKKKALEAKAEADEDKKSLEAKTEAEAPKKAQKPAES